MPERFADLVDHFERSCAKYADRPLYGEHRAGAWVWTSYAEVHQRVQHARAGLAQLGVGRGDRVAILARNRPEWVIAAYATYGLGATFVPMYPALAARDSVFVLRDSGAKVVFVASDGSDRIDVIRNELPSLKHLVLLDRAGPESFADLLAMGERAPVPATKPSPRTIAGFAYTSGTRGFPKAVLQSHGNIVANVHALHQLFPLVPEDIAVSFLSWATPYGQLCEVHTLLSFGCAVAINNRWERAFESLREIKPTILFGAPSLLERVLPMVEKLPAEEARACLGGRSKYLISSGTPLDSEVAQLFDAKGLPLYEGYGLSEAGPVSVNAPGARKFGSVGKLVPGVRVEIVGDDEEGEIVVYGPGVMIGYHERPQETSRVFTRDGGLRTGDLGHLDHDGFLHVSGRFEDRIELSTGRVVMPERIEAHLALSPYIDHVVLWGSARPYLVAVVVLDVEALRAWAKERDLGTPILTADPHVHQLIESELALLSADVREFERPRAFVMTTERFTLENGLLTPTLKVRRPNVIARHRNTLEELYGPEERRSHESVA
ncbi:MAG: AMP-dependent synthetase/ligase [Polyangiales bacterium]